MISISGWIKRSSRLAVKGRGIGLASYRSVLVLRLSEVRGELARSLIIRSVRKERVSPDLFNQMFNHDDSGSLVSTCHKKEKLCWLIS